MLFEYFIIATYFATLMVPVAVVVAVFWLEANQPETFDHIPDFFENYPLPDEGQSLETQPPYQLPQGEEPPYRLPERPFSPPRDVPVETVDDHEQT